MSVFSDARRPRRITAGLGLLGFAALLVIQDPLDPTGAAGFYDASIRHPGLLTASALMLLASAVLTVPAIGAVIHQARDRGSLLAHLGGLFTLLGALGHMGLATVYLVMRSLAGGDPGQMRAFEDRLNSDAALMIFVVLLTSFGIGIALLSWAAWRAGLIGWWAPAMITAVAIAHNALPDDPPMPVQLAALGVIAVVFGRLGVRTLRLSDTDWDHTSASAPEPFSTAATSD
ncbi:hypothetical protein [Nonomuraea turcica]|uniref:hypothetical protein n=1 Tax=Nonomuraea sp. G32 TaxID=3067274 RepID=UPI00273C61F6|nr:hypothetical protein [Nonomuraea sp. G32]MDP4501969.1 hypothetical protein [Nonomuraea sp. G32]